jgi:hypothetical protein
MGQPAAFAVPTAFTFGKEQNDLVGPGYFNATLTPEILRSSASRFSSDPNS